MKLGWEVTPGGLGPAEHARIDELGAKGWKAGRIAQVIRKHTATVYWYMLCNGLVTRAAKHRTAPAEPYKRGRHWIYPWSAEEDLYIEARRGEGLNYRQIAERAVKQFGKPRSAHSVHVRLMILSADTRDAA